MKYRILYIAFLLFSFFSSYAQHEHHEMHMPKQKDTTEQMSNMQMNNISMDMSDMSHSYSLNLPMSRNGSGTAWLPDASPMYGYMKHSPHWMFMVHGNLFIRYNKQDISGKGERGNEKWDAPNYIMGMAQRKVGKNGLLHISAMFSLDAFITGKTGYPLLFQTGETANGLPLVDRQHPHDLFAELSIGYSYALSKKSDVFVYVGYPGEPALGSVAFMHRPSAMFNPDAPITHHWNDGTHITYGVATVGVRYKKIKLETSSFTGREPDENRYDLDKASFDSWSAKLSYNPSPNWTFQISHGSIKSPESLYPDENVDRTTASIVYSRPLVNNMLLDITALWGLNQISGQDGSNAFLVEGNLKMKRLATYMRYEWVQKSGEELALNPFLYDPEKMFAINAFTIGAGYDLAKIGYVQTAIGAQLSVYHAVSELDPLYGKNPMAGEIYLHIYPAIMN